MKPLLYPSEKIVRASLKYGAVFIVYEPDPTRIWNTAFETIERLSFIVFLFRGIFEFGQAPSALQAGVHTLESLPTWTNSLSRNRLG